MNSLIEGNLFVYKDTILGGLTGYDITGSVTQNNYYWLSGMNVGYSQNDLYNYQVLNNYVHDAMKLTAAGTWDALAMTGNTFVGPLTNFTSSDFPSNTYYTLGSPPTTNLIVVRQNAYEANRAHVFVYNWHNDSTVAVDLSGAVANGTAINIMNAQDFYGTPVWTGTYGGGTVTLPMTGLTVAAGYGYTSPGTTGPAFAAFIVRAQGA